MSGPQKVESFGRHLDFLDTSKSPRRQRLSERVHMLGAPAFAYFVRDAERIFGIDLSDLLEQYAILAEPELLGAICAYGGDRFTDPVFVIDGGRS